MQSSNHEQAQHGSRARLSDDNVSVNSWTHGDGNGFDDATPVSPILAAAESRQQDPPSHQVQQHQQHAPRASREQTERSSQDYDADRNHSLAQASPTENSQSSLSPRANESSSSGTLSAWQRLMSMWMYGWTAEVVGCLLSFLSLIAIIIILVLHSGLPLPAWPLGITINALIAVFGVLLKAGMLVPLSEGISHLKWQWFSQGPRKLMDMEEFDAASRGPWGSFLFLFRSDEQNNGGSAWLGPWRFVRSLFVWKRS